MLIVDCLDRPHQAVQFVYIDFLAWPPSLLDIFTVLTAGTKQSEHVDQYTTQVNPCATRGL